MKIIYLSGLIPESHRNLINKNSIGAIQNAADSLQHGFLEGLSRCLSGKLTVINLPFVGSYPRRFKQIFYPSAVEVINESSIFTIGFINFAVIKHLFRIYASFKNILKHAQNVDWIVIYSAHPPFLISALLCKYLKKNIRLCLILPDLPEHMGAKSGFQGILNASFTNLFYKLISRFDCYALLTLKMGERLGASKDKYVVIEGIARQGDRNNNLTTSPNQIRSILYTGTLAEKYGVKNLVDAFLQLKEENIQLWICGEGDSRSYIEEQSAKDSRINFYGQVDRLESIRLQKIATVLVNPRLPGGEYTEYSFPSKIMEYMSSGRPVVMYQLSGIPDEYFSHCFIPSDFTVQQLANCLKGILNMTDDELAAVGNSARNFVLDHKNPDAQVKKMIGLMKSLT